MKQFSAVRYVLSFIYVNMGYWRNVHFLFQCTLKFYLNKVSSMKNDNWIPYLQRTRPSKIRRIRRYANNIVKRVKKTSKFNNVNTMDKAYDKLIYRTFWILDFSVNIIFDIIRIFRSSKQYDNCFNVSSTKLLSNLK